MKKLLFLLPFVAMTLAGCNNKQPESIQSSVEDSSEVISSEVSSEEPSEVSSEDPSEISSEEDPSEEQVKTIEEVVNDINGVFNPLIGSDILAWYEEYNCYIGGLKLRAAEHATDDQHATELQEATEFIVGYLPEYLTIDVAGYEEEYDDYYIGLSVDEVGVDNFGYVNTDGNIIVQIQVAELAE